MNTNERSSMKSKKGLLTRLTMLTILTFQVMTGQLYAQKAPVGNDSSTPLHLLTPDYPTPYGVPDAVAVKATLDRVLTYLDATTPPTLENKRSKQP
ncbi:MAG: glycoside hydrolase family 88 protein, partial [Bacteroidales bacterium]|nr:glycoside hydrolase family 88 protein [Bacteroidales bacterium]